MLIKRKLYSSDEDSYYDDDSLDYESLKEPLFKRKKRLETDEEKMDKKYKRLRNLGLASLGTSAIMGAGYGIGKKRIKNPNSKVTKKDLRGAGVGAASLATIGTGLTTYASIKRHNLKKKSKEEGEKKDDNTKK